MPDRSQHGLLSSLYPTTSWRVSESKGCEISGHVQSNAFYLRLKTASPTKVDINGTSFHTWTDCKARTNCQNQQLAVLTLAWAYILSARLVELQGTETSQLRYTEQSAPIDHLHDSACQCIPVDVGAVRSSVVRWFAATLAPREGFQASIHRDGDGTNSVPWVYSLGVETSHFHIIYGGIPKDNNKLNHDRPLSSFEALQSLIDFCNYHGLSIYQLHVGLATALLFPTHSLSRQGPNLPPPSTADELQAEPSPVIGKQALDELYEDLPYHITLSCAVEVVMSSLCGLFWNPYISSNLCSPWLQPLLDLRDTETYKSNPGRFNEILAMISARRSPTIVYLFLGAAVSGWIFRGLESGSSWPTIDRTSRIRVDGSSAFIYGLGRRGSLL